MQKEKYITFISNKRKIVISIGTILYAVMEGNKAKIHICGGEVYETRMALGKLEEKLGENFIKVSRGCLASEAEPLKRSVSTVEIQPKICDTG